MSAKVFVSAGTPADDSQRTLRDGVVSALEAAGLTPRLMSDRDWDYKNPLRGIRHAMAECSGAIVIAYPRYQFPTGLELRKDDRQSRVARRDRVRDHGRDGAVVCLRVWEIDGQLASSAH